MAVQDGVNRRDFFLRAGAMGMLGAMPELAMADGGGFAGQAASNMVHEVAQPSAEDLAPPTHSVNFAVCGMSSLIHAPDWPWRANANFEGTTGKLSCADDMLVRRCPMRIDSGRSVPWNSVRRGL